MMAPGDHPAAPAVTTAPHALAPYISNLQSLTLPLKATPAFRLTLSKNLGVIPDFSFCQTPQVHEKIIWALLSKHFQNLSTSHHLPCHHPVQDTIIPHHIIAKTS